MSKLNLQKRKVIARDGTPVRLVYDEEADILDIIFGENGPATGIELTDYMLLRLNKSEKRAVSLVLRHFSVLSEQTEYGPRSFPLEQLNKLPEDLRELVLQLITSLPVKQFLKLSQLQTSPVEQIAVAFVESQPMTAFA